MPLMVIKLSLKCKTGCAFIADTEFTPTFNSLMAAIIKPILSCQPEIHCLRLMVMHLVLSYIYLSERPQSGQLEGGFFTIPSPFQVYGITHVSKP